MPSLYAALSILNKFGNNDEKIFEAVQLIRQSELLSAVTLGVAKSNTTEQKLRKLIRKYFSLKSYINKASAQFIEDAKSETTFSNDFGGTRESIELMRRDLENLKTKITSKLFSMEKITMRRPRTLKKSNTLSQKTK